MKIKDLKINFRYLGGNIACLSVDSIAGESIHNDINNEEAIIIFNSLVGEKENCQTVKTLLKENKELKNQLEEYRKTNEHLLDKKQFLKQENQLLKKRLENCYCNRTDCSGRIKDSKVYDSFVQKVETQQKEFINYLEDEIKKLQKIKETELDYDILKDVIPQLLDYKEILQKYKEIIGVSDDNKTTI